MNTKSAILALYLKRSGFHGPLNFEIVKKMARPSKKRNCHCDPNFCPNDLKFAQQLDFIII